MGNKEVKFKLQFPIGEGSKQITELILKRPKVKDLAVMDMATGDISKMIEFLAKISGVSVNHIKEMDSVDWINLQEEVKPFLTASTAMKDT